MTGDDGFVGSHTARGIGGKESIYCEMPADYFELINELKAKNYIGSILDVQSAIFCAGHQFRRPNCIG